MIRDDLLEFSDEHLQVGDWTFTDDDSVMWLVVPSSIGPTYKELIRLPIQVDGQPNKYPYKDPHPTWTWDGNKEAPTLSPSIRVFGNRLSEGGWGPDRWHGFLRAGKLVNA